MTVDNSIHQMQLLAVSKEIAQRQRPAMLYAILTVLALTAFSYQVRLVYQNFPDWFGRPNAPTRPFFAEDTATEPIRIGFLTRDATKAGLVDGDELVAINGKPVVGTAVFGEAMHAARAGDILHVTVRRAGQLSTAAVTLRGGGHHDLVWLIMSVLLVVVAPVLSLGIGFWVAFVRPRDPLSWLLLILLGTFAVFYNADAEQWGPVVRDLAIIYRFGLEYAFPIAALLFGLHFPEPFPRQGRWLWWYRLAWLLIVPSALLGVVGLVDAVATVENRAAVMGLDRMLATLGTALPTLLTFACFPVFFAALAVKWKNATSADNRRRLSLMFWGTLLGLGPVMALQVIAGIVNQPVEVYFAWWLFVPAYLLTALVPVTFAYVIVVQRAMDVRLMLRQGLRYTLARNGIVVLQLVLAGALASAAATLLFGHRVNQFQKTAIIAAGLGLLFLLRRGALHWRVSLDRRFFRDAYNAEQILSELGDQVRTMVETRPLLETVAARIAESLHVPRVAVLLNGGALYQPAYTLGYDTAPKAVFPENAATVERLRKEHEPARVYFQDPNSWIYREPAMKDVERAHLAEFGGGIALTAGREGQADRVHESRSKTLGRTLHRFRPAIAEVFSRSNGAGPRSRAAHGGGQRGNRATRTAESRAGNRPRGAGTIVPAEPSRHPGA